MYFLEMKGLSIFFISCRAETSVYNCLVKSESNLMFLFIVNTVYNLTGMISRNRANICVDFFRLVL